LLGGLVLWGTQIACALAVPPAGAQVASRRQPAAQAQAEQTTTQAAEAAQLEPHRREAAPEQYPRRDGERAVTGDSCLFFDDFACPTVAPRHWERTAGATLATDLRQRAQAASAVRLSAIRRGVDAEPELRSVALTLADVPAAELTYTVQHRGVEAGETLVVEYLADRGEWYPLERVVADGRDSVRFARHVRPLPDDALHGAFQFRFRARVDDRDDAWYVGEVLVAAYEPFHTLNVQAWPPRNAFVQVIAEDRAEWWDGTTPFTRSLPADMRTHLVAPPVVAEWVFSHWAVDGVLTTERERVLTLELSKDVEAVAHYRPGVPGQAEARLTIVSTPEPGVPIAVGPEADRLYADLTTQAGYECLMGEWLTLVAPERLPRFVFARWVVNGQPSSPGENALVHRADGDDVLVAEYVLLGDMNGDGQLDELDVDEFVLALIDPSGYTDRHPELSRTLRGDVNGDGAFDALDVEGFVDLLVSD
jgi:hypothetical protein